MKEGCGLKGNGYEGEVGQSANELANLHAAININEQLNASAVVALSSRIYQPVRSFPHLDFINIIDCVNAFGRSISLLVATN